MYLLSTLIVGERRPTIRVHQSLPLRIRSGLSTHDKTVIVFNKIFKFCLLKTVIWFMVYDLCLELGETFFLDPDPNQNISDPPHGSLGPSEIIQCSYLVRGASRREATFSGSNSLFKNKSWWTQQQSIQFFGRIPLLCPIRNIFVQ